ncbi:scavenger receptor class b, member 2 [Plakobranchus ocellatus]|uniref:Scavenger receptor class b, member 2 n=1 Tax=Plakobranchus ocellatus TaxID=259542 RepID=A0AAV4AP74_9GAST|nr:scavenger receptor class b, member 2 [Plakobranchus ocellatus]
MVARKSIVLCVVGFFGVAFLCVGCGFIKIFDDMIHKQVKENIPLKRGSESFKHWQKTTTPIYFQIFVFDMTNPKEVLKGQKPVVNQKGPYTYRERREKKDIKFYDNGTVSYREDQWFEFDREMSVGPEEDTFTNVNILMVTIMNLLRNEFMILKMALDVMFDVVKESLFQKLSIHDILWGYEDNLLKEAKKIAAAFNRSLPISDKFGLFFQKNGTDDGVYLINDGNKSIDHFGEIQFWNGMRKLNYWNSEIANAINGSDGTIYPPWTEKSETKYLFSSDLCRSLGLTYSDEVTVKGIPLYKFVAPDIMFGNVSTNPYNAGFCTPPGNCLPAGLLNVSACRSGSPIVMSMPNFLGCDESVQNYVEGIRPIREDHESHIDVEPITGVVMRAAKRLQINVHLEKIDGFKSTKNLKPFYMPVLWLNESAVIGGDDAHKFKSDVLDMLKITDAIKYGLIALGGFLMLCVIGVLIVASLKSKGTTGSLRVNSEDEDPLLSPNGYGPAPIST